MIKTEEDSDLWMIVAIVQPFKLDAIVLALEQMSEFHGITVSECRGFGQGKLLRERTRTASGVLQSPGNDDVRDFKSKLKLEVAVSSRGEAEKLMDVIGAAAHTGRGGDGRIFLWPMSCALRIRNFQGSL